MDLSKRSIVMNVFFNLQFNYCPVIWLRHNCTTNRKINRLHERCLRIIYNHKQSSFKMLFEKDSSVSIHNRNIHCLATYKVSNGLSPSSSQQFLDNKNSHPDNLRIVFTLGSWRQLACIYCNFIHSYFFNVDSFMYLMFVNF